MENGMQMTFEECMPETFQKQIAGVSDSLVRTYPLQESKPDFKEIVQACFSELCTLSDSSKKKINPLTFSLRTLKNLLSVNGGWDFARLLIEMDRAGYDAEWQVLNSKDFGVPQNRERCFIIGHLRSRSTAKIFPVERADRENSIQIIGHRNGYKRNTQVFVQDGITEALSTCQGEERGHHTALPCFIDLCYQGSQMTDTARCLKARYYKGVANHAGQDSGIAIKVIGEVNSSQDGYAVWYEKYQCYIAIRKLTPKECFRLQGWSDDYFKKAQFVNSDSQLYKQAGNGVTVTVIETIARKMNVNLN